MNTRAVWLEEIVRREPPLKTGPAIEHGTVYVDALRYPQCYTVAAVSRLGEHSERRMVRTTSMIAEVESACWGLACAYLWEMPVVEIVTDCQGVIHHLERSRPGFAAARRLARMAERYPGRAAFRWVPRGENRAAHRVARGATKTRRGAKKGLATAGEVLAGRIAIRAGGSSRGSGLVRIDLD